jgi:hypothetical protein
MGGLDENHPIHRAGLVNARCLVAHPGQARATTAPATSMVTTSGHAVVLVTLLTLAACRAPTPPVEFVEYAPLPEYAAWYRELEACTRYDGPDLQDIEFWQLPDATVINTPDTTLMAFYERPRRIVIAGFYITSKPLIQHELLHLLLKGNDPFHHSRFFVTCVGR